MMEEIEIAAPELSVINAPALLAKEFPDPNWAVHGIIPEGVTLLVGRPKMGKSWLALGIGIAVSCGGRALSAREVTQGSVLYLALEDNERRLQKRCRKLLEENHCIGLDFATRCPRLDEGGADVIEGWLQGHDDARLVIVDTLAKVRPQNNGRQNGYNEDYAVGEFLLPLAHQHGVAILVIHHTRKAEADDWMDEISGTTGLTGGVDGALVLRRTRGDADAILHVTGRDIEDDQDLALQWDQSRATWAIVGDADDYQQTTARRKVLQAVRAAGKPITTKEIAERTGDKYENIRQVVYKLEDSGEIHRAGGNNKSGYTFGITGYNDNNNYNKSQNGGEVVTDVMDVTCIPGSQPPLKDNKRAVADAYRQAKEGE